MEEGVFTVLGAVPAVAACDPWPLLTPGSAGQSGGPVMMGVQ